MSADSASKPLKKAVIFNVFGHSKSGDAVLLETLIDAVVGGAAGEVHCSKIAEMMTGRIASAEIAP